MSKILFIDAGHGGVDKNGNYTTPPKNGKYFDHKKMQFHKGTTFLEGVFNRDFARKFMVHATKLGFNCVPVYHPESDTTLGNRVEIANDAFSRFGNDGIYLSFHSNASGVGTARGFNLFYHPNSAKGKALATKIVHPIQNVFIKSGSISPFPLRDGYMNAEKTAIFYVLQATKPVSLLFEFGFFDNYEDAKMLFNEEFQENLAFELAKTLKDTLNV